MTVPVTITRDGSKLILPWHDGLASVIPHARPLDYNGVRMMVMPNADTEARLARNLGLAVPPPILTAYDWAGTKPWGIQRTTAAMMVENPRLFVLNTMGTGKSLSALYACDYLLKTGQAKKILVAAPLSTLTPVWEAEVFRFMPHRRVSVVYNSDKKQRIKALAKLADIYVTNHHGLVVMTKELAAAGFDVVVLDELAVFRNRSTGLWKAANQVCEKATWVWGLTGSPTPMSPTDAWAQVKLLSPGKVPRSMTAFRTMTMNQVSQFRWVPKPDATSIVHGVMQPAVRFTREDVMELPPTTYVDRKVELDDVVAKAYRMMHDRLRMASDQGSITSANEGVLHGKLLQIAMGWVYTDDRTIYALPSKARLDALTEVITETDRKVIVFVPYVHALEGVTEYLRKQGFDTALIHGGVPRHARDKIFTDFQHKDTPRVLVAHPKTMAHGLTLTAANTIVWYAPYPDLEVYEQANARITRPGQTAKTLIVHLHGGTQVERLTYRRLKERAKMQGLLLHLFREQTSVI